MIRNLLITAVLAVALTGCATVPSTSTSPQMVFAQTCKAYTGALTVMTARHTQGKLSPAHVATVDTLNKVVTPLCKSKVVPSNPAQETAIVNKALASLASIKKTAP